MRTCAHMCTNCSIHCTRTAKRLESKRKVSRVCVCVLCIMTTTTTRPVIYTSKHRMKLCREKRELSVSAHTHDVSTGFYAACSLMLSCVMLRIVSRSALYGVVIVSSLETETCFSVTEPRRRRCTHTNNSFGCANICVRARLHRLHFASEAGGDFGRTDKDACD